MDDGGVDGGGGPTPRPPRRDALADTGFPIVASAHRTRDAACAPRAPRADGGPGEERRCWRCYRCAWGRRRAPGRVGVRVCVVRVEAVAPYEAEAPLSGDASEGDLGKARRACGRWPRGGSQRGWRVVVQSYSIWMDEADDTGAEAFRVEGADEYEWRRSTDVIKMSREGHEGWTLGRKGHKPTFYEENAQGRPQTLHEEVRDVPRTSPGMNEGTYAIKPAHRPTSHVLLTTLGQEEP